MIFYILILLGIGYAIYRFFAGLDLSATEKKYYRARHRFFTQSEYVFFLELEKLNNGKYHLFSKVRLEDIVEVLPGIEHKVAYGKRNSIKSRHIDFVLIDKETGQVYCAIELDGKSHKSKKQQESDQKKNMILKQCEVQLHRVRVGQDYSQVISRILSPPEQNSTKE